MRDLGRRSGWLLVWACALALTAPAVYGGEAPTSVVDWLRARGEDASFEARARRFATHFPREGYRGTAEQNVRLLQALQGAPAQPGRRPPATTGNALAPWTVTGHGWRVTLDRGAQVLRLDVPERVVWEAKPGLREEPVLPTLPLRGRGGLFVSAAALGLKAKQLDDGLYAAVELAVHRGHGGTFVADHVLETLRRLLAEQAAADRGAAVVCAARDYGKGRHGDPLPDTLRVAVAREKAAFEGSPIRSKPIGFYTWSDELIRVFRRDRMLQTPLTSRAEVATVARLIRADPYRLAAYRKTLRLAARLTNPLAHPDVLQPPTAKRPSQRQPYFVLPPSRAHETDLAKRLWGVEVPEGANLFDELISRVRDGSLSLAPREDSGWYDHVTWSLEPLLRPEAQPEAARLAFTHGYKDHLEALFKGLLALTRETHIKQLEIPFCGACAPPPEIHVGPELTVEPLATHYRRRADAYRFVRTVLEEAFGAGALAGLHRLTIDGPVALDLDTELGLMTRLFDGAAETALEEIGAAEADPGPEGDALRAVFGTWRALAPNDPDVARDGRMMVPVLHDLGRGKTKVWAFLGWQTAPLTISHATRPGVRGWERLPGGAEERKPELVFRAQHAEIAYPVVAEVYVTELLDRRAFRAHCDRWKTRSAILANLR